MRCGVKVAGYSKIHLCADVIVSRRGYNSGQLRRVAGAVIWAGACRGVCADKLMLFKDSLRNVFLSSKFSDELFSLIENWNKISRQHNRFTGAPMNYRGRRQRAPMNKSWGRWCPQIFGCGMAGARLYCKDLVEWWTRLCWRTWDDNWPGVEKGSDRRIG